MLACARGGLPVGEYAPRLVKKAVVGTGGVVLLINLLVDLSYVFFDPRIRY